MPNARPSPVKLCAAVMAISTHPTKPVTMVTSSIPMPAVMIVPLLSVEMASSKWVSNNAMTEIRTTLMTVPTTAGFKSAATVS